MKQGRGGSRTPFEILQDVARLGDARDIALWDEWVRVSRGRRQIVLSKGLRAMADLAPERTDEEIAADEYGDVDRLVVDGQSWRTHIAFQPSVRVGILDRLETGGLKEVTAYLDSLDVRYWLCDSQTGSPLPDERGEVPVEAGDVRPDSLIRPRVKKYKCDSRQTRVILDGQGCYVR